MCRETPLNSEPLVSIVVPTYNEAEDIGRTLDALVQLDYPRREIIIVDASTDDTPLIVRQYEQRGVRLLEQEGSGGRAAARNQGIRAARGEIVVILNADVFPSPDFLRRIISCYQEDDVDYLLVESQVANTQFLFPRYLEAQHRHTYEEQTWLNWTEGFSCRRDAALAVGLFPETHPIPLCAGEDAIFSGSLERHGYRKAINRSIVVPHVAPHRLSAYWSQRYGRGRGVPLRLHLVDGVPLWLLRPYILWNLLTTVGRILLVVPVLIYAGRLALHSPRKQLDILPFAFARVIEIVANRVGEWVGYRELARVTPAETPGGSISR